MIIAARFIPSKPVSDDVFRLDKHNDLEKLKINAAVKCSNGFTLVSRLYSVNVPDFHEDLENNNYSIELPFIRVDSMDKINYFLHKGRFIDVNFGNIKEILKFEEKYESRELKDHTLTEIFNHMNQETIQKALDILIEHKVQKLLPICAALILW